MALRFVDQGTAGLTRRLWRGKWAYFDPHGARIADAAEIKRLNAIALPPAYSDAWFSIDPEAHLLATGIDARGRKEPGARPFTVGRTRCPVTCGLDQLPSG